MIYSYKFASESAKVLAEHMGIKRIKHVDSKFVGDENRIIINWGASAVPKEVEKCMIINNPDAVKIASDKLAFFTHVSDKVQVPEYTTDKAVALSWLDNGHTVFGRTSLKGSGGKDIIIFETLDRDKLVEDKKSVLYTQYQPKKDEYRVHVVNGKVIGVRRKGFKKPHRLNIKPNFKIRSHDNFFVFVKEGLNVPSEVEEQAVLAVEACGLDFGAVDVIWNDSRQMAYVLEVNTAPGLEGSSIDMYASAFEQFYKKPKNIKPKSWSQFVYDEGGKNWPVDFNPEIFGGET